MEHDGIVAPKDVIIEEEDVALQQFSDNIKVHSVLKNLQCYQLLQSVCLWKSILKHSPDPTQYLWLQMNE